ncbi:MAG: aminoacyl-tRNA hydrolase [Planctomycetaceae bacterium]
MKLVVGLGNPGAKYAGTRHNVGFDVVAELAGRHLAGTPQTRFQADFTDVSIAGTKVLLVTPLTYMNRSGESVWQFVRFFQVEPENLAVICDDMNLPLEKLRWRASGSAGGQKGLADIIQRLGREDFPRLRIGIGRPPGRMDAVNFVLARFREEESAAVQLTLRRAADSVEMWVRDGISAAMNQYNREPDA